MNYMDEESDGEPPAFFEPPHLQALGLVIDDMDKENDAFTINCPIQSPSNVNLSETSPTKAQRINIRSMRHKKSVSSSHLITPQPSTFIKAKSVEEGIRKSSKKKKRRTNNKGIKRSISRSPAPGSTSKSPKKRNKKRLKYEVIRLTAQAIGYKSKVVSMEDKAFDNEEMYQKRIQVQEIEINKLNKLVDKLKNKTKNTSISDGERDEGLKLRRKHKRRRSKSASLQIENEKLKEELSKKFDLELVREANERCVEIERKYKENIKQMKDSIICDKCMKITQENAELNKKLEWMENTIEELQEENKELEQCVEEMEMLRNDKLGFAVRNSELKQQIKQYKSDEKEYSEKIDELILQCDDLTQQKELLIDEAETHAKMKTEYMTERNKLKMEQNEMKEHMSDLRIKYDDKCKESDKVRDENNKLLNKVNELGENGNKCKQKDEKINMLLQDNETQKNEIEEVVCENKALKFDVDAFSEKYNSLLKTFNEKDSEFQSLETRLTNKIKNDEMDKMEEAMTNLTTEKQTIQNQYDETRMELLKAKNEHKSLEAEKEEIIFSKDGEIMRLKCSLKHIERINNELKRENEKINNNDEYIRIIKVLKNKLNKQRDNAEKFIEKYKSDMKAQAELRDAYKEEIKEQRKLRDKFKEEIVKLKRYIDVLENKKQKHCVALEKKFIGLINNAEKELNKMKSIYGKLIKNRDDKIKKKDDKIKRLEKVIQNYEKKLMDMTMNHAEEIRGKNIKIYELNHSK